MNELWVARDGDCVIWQFEIKPVWCPDTNAWRSDDDGEWFIDLPDGYYENLKPGQCRRLVLAEETSE